MSGARTAPFIENCVAVSDKINYRNQKTIPIIDLRRKDAPFIENRDAVSDRSIIESYTKCVLTPYCLRMLTRTILLPLYRSYFVYKSFKYFLNLTHDLDISCDYTNIIRTKQRTAPKSKPISEVCQ
jgi:hypothetical protein